MRKLKRVFSLCVPVKYFIFYFNLVRKMNSYNIRDFMGFLVKHLKIIQNNLLHFEIRNSINK